jgi:hypothetical protein
MTYKRNVWPTRCAVDTRPFPMAAPDASNTDPIPCDTVVPGSSNHLNPNAQHTAAKHVSRCSECFARSRIGRPHTLGCIRWKIQNSWISSSNWLASIIALGYSGHRLQIHSVSWLAGFVFDTIPQLDQHTEVCPKDRTDLPSGRSTTTDTATGTVLLRPVESPDSHRCAVRQRVLVERSALVHREPTIRFGGCWLST